MKYLALIGIVSIFVFALLSVIMIPDVVRESLTIAFRAVVYSLMAAIGVGVAYGLWNGLERLLMLRAQRHQVEHDAHVKIIQAPAQDRVWAHERRTGQYRNLTMESRTAVGPGDNRPPTDMELRAWAHYYQSLQAPRVIGAERTILEKPEDKLDVLSVVRQRGCYLVVGAMDAGKTTLLQWFAEERLRLGWNVAVLDPHSPREKWPAGCAVIGSGRNFDAIDTALKRLLQTMDQRYKQVSAGEVGENQHAGIAVIIEEYMAIYENVPDVSRILTALLTESRKANIDIAIGSHSRRVRSLGLDGKGDLLENLRVIHLMKRSTGEREAIIEAQHEKTPAALPGAYEVISGNGDDDFALLSRPPEPDEKERLILKLHAAGKSLKEISEAVWGAGKFGSYYNEQIRETVEKWG